MIFIDAYDLGKTSLGNQFVKEKFSNKPLGATQEWNYQQGYQITPLDSLTISYMAEKQFMVGERKVKLFIWDLKEG